MKTRMCEIVQQIKYIDINFLKSVLVDKSSIKDYAYIIHDKDVDTEPHIHLAIRLKDSYDTKYISSWFNVPEQYINKVKGRWSDMLKYLTHENAPEKFQYSEAEVFSNFDFAIEKNKTGSNQRKEDIINKIVTGDIREFNYWQHISAIEYDKYRKSIDNAFKFRLDLIKGVERDMECVFITGDSGTGKSTYAKQIAKNKGYSVYVSSGSNDILDDYKGQDCIILDDLRPSCIGLSDLLKMLDNHTSSTIKSRYKNKVLECKMIIITTTLNIDSFFNNVFSDEKETSIQLKRRCKTRLRFTMEYIYMSVWQEKSRVYSKEMPIQNPIAFEHKKNDMTRDEALSFLQSVLGNTLNIVNEIKENQDEYLRPVYDDSNIPFDK